MTDSLHARAACRPDGKVLVRCHAGCDQKHVIADGDEPGEMAARAAALRWKRGGRRVRIARPPHGMDFNDLLVRRGLEEGAR